MGGAKPVPEMGFTLGGLDELMDHEVLCCLAVDGEGKVHGVTSWLPVYGRAGWSAGRWTSCGGAADGFPGVMEFLIASAVQDCRSSVEVISLSGSPLAKDRDPATARRDVPAGTCRRWQATVPEGWDAGDTGPEGLAGLLDMVGKALEPVYGFRSLATSNPGSSPNTARCT